MRKIPLQIDFVSRTARAGEMVYIYIYIYMCVCVCVCGIFCSKSIKMY